MLVLVDGKTRAFQEVSFKQIGPNMANFGYPRKVDLQLISILCIYTYI